MRTDLRYLPRHRAAALRLLPVDYTAITLVNTNPGLAQKRLSQAIKASPPNLTTLLDRLEACGLVLRHRNPADKTAAEPEREATDILTDDERAEPLRLLQNIFLKD